MSPEPGLYVHVPFCSSLCPYCDFAVSLGTEARRAKYVDLLDVEIALRARPVAPFDTLYFGGGTPSSLSIESLDRLIGTISGAGWLAPGCRIFLEANPEDVSDLSLAGWRALGVSTLSLGVQSFDPGSLRFLGRRHRPDEAERAVTRARGAGFETVSVDLIYGLPGQTEERLRKDLEAAVRLEPDHFSCYQLTVHEKTLFGRRRREGRLEEASEAAQSALFRLAHQVLESAGYEAYEVSNFARAPSHRSRHNRKYWAHAPYLGLGPGAHSFDGRIRSWNARSFFDWERKLRLREVPVAGRERLADEELLLETLMLRLRTREGFDLDEVERRFGVDLLDLNRAFIEKALEDALLVRDGSWIRPTLDGLAVADGLASAFRLPQSPWNPARL